MGMNKKILYSIIGLVLVGGLFSVVYAGPIINTITFVGLTVFQENAQFDKDVNIDGTLGGSTIDNLQTQIDNVPADLADGDQDTLDKLRRVQTYNALPCSVLNGQSWVTIDHLMNPEGRVLTQVDFEELPNDFPFFAYASISEPTIAEVVLFAGNFPPRNWAFTEGQLLSISSNTALFSLLGITYGGDGRTTFALPDMRCLEAEGGPRHIIALVGVYPSRN